MAGAEKICDDWEKSQNVKVVRLAEVRSCRVLLKDFGNSAVVWRRD
jgi:hypothetical protein